MTGLANGKTYAFTVSATNAVGPGGSSTESYGTPLRFSDVPALAPFYADIMWMAYAGITTGLPDGSFAPNATVQRQAMAAFLYRYLDRPLGDHPPCVSAPYNDVPIGAPFCGEIAWMKTTGITTGYADGGFHPNDPVARQAMAAFLYRFKLNPNGVNPTCSIAPYTDVLVGAPFCGEITWMKTTGITSGYLDGGYHPADPIARQAMAAFLHRLSLLP